MKAGTVFFPRPQFAIEEPGGEERQRLVVIPAAPGADLVIGQAALALAALNTFLNAVLGLCSLTANLIHTTWRPIS